MRQLPGLVGVPEPSEQDVIVQMVVEVAGLFLPLAGAWAAGGLSRRVDSQSRKEGDSTGLRQGPGFPPANIPTSRDQ